MFIWCFRAAWQFFNFCENKIISFCLFGTGPAEKDSNIHSSCCWTSVDRTWPDSTCDLFIGVFEDKHWWLSYWVIQITFTCHLSSFLTTHLQLYKNLLTFSTSTAILSFRCNFLQSTTKISINLQELTNLEICNLKIYRFKLSLLYNLQLK